MSSNPGCMKILLELLSVAAWDEPSIWTRWQEKPASGLAGGDRFLHLCHRCDQWCGFSPPWNDMLSPPGLQSKVRHHKGECVYAKKCQRALERRAEGRQRRR